MTGPRGWAHVGVLRPFGGLAGLSILAVMIVYASVARASLEQAAGGRAGLNVWDQVVRVAYDPYLIVFLLLPWSLFLAAHDAVRLGAPEMLIRDGSYRQWGWRVARHSLQRLSAVGVCWLITAVVTSWGLPWGWGWSAAAGSLDHGVVVALGLPPGMAVLGNVVLSAATAAGLFVVVAAVRLYGGVWSYLVAAATWGCTVVAFKVVAIPTVLDPANGFQLHRSAAAWGSLPAALVAALLPLLLAVLGLRLRDAQQRNGRSRGLAMRIYLAVSMGSIALLAGRDAVSAPADAVFSVFYGATPQGTDVAHYLLAAIVFCGFAFVYSLAIEDELSGHIFLVALRAGTFWRWWWRFSRPWLLGALVLPIAAAGWAVLVASLAHATVDPLPALAPAAAVAYQMIVNGWLQLTFYLVVVLLARWASGVTAAPAIALALVVILGLPGVQRLVPVPAFANSVGISAAGWSSVIGSTVQLLCYTGLALVGLRWVLGRGAGPLVREG